MNIPIILASGSQARHELLENAGVAHQVIKPMVDEETIFASMRAHGVRPRDIADALAEHKARKVSLKNPGSVVIGSDQVLDLAGKTMQKPNDRNDAFAQLQTMSGARHSLLSAAVIYQDGEPLWRYVGQARLEMRNLSDAFIGSYLDRNWDSIRHCVGCYKLEEEGVRLFFKIEGDYFTVLGLPLVELLGYLTTKGVLEG